MPFLGVEPVQEFASVAKQTITGDGSTAYTLTHSVASANDLAVFVNNVRQEPTTAYSASGGTITFTEAIASTDSCYVVYLARTFQTVSPADNSVNADQISYPLTNFSSTGIDDNADATAITIDSSERVGIGTTSPSYKLEVVGQAQTDTLLVDTVGGVNSGFLGGRSDWTGGSTDNNFAIGSYQSNMCFFTNNNGTERMRIDSSGRVGIGTTSPASPLHVQADGIGLRFDGTANTSRNIFFRNTTSANPAQVYADGSLRLFTEDSGTDIRFHTNSNGTNNERMRVTANGLTFNGDTAAANALDDYEEGTWTPIIKGYSQDDSNLTQTYSTQTGVYRKVGSLVYATCRITLSNKGNMAGNYILLKGWPFNFGGTTTTAGYGGINYFTGVGNSVSSIWWELGGGSTNAAWLSYVSGSSAGASSYMPVSGINNNFYFHCSAVYYA